MDIKEIIRHMSKSFFVLFFAMMISASIIIWLQDTDAVPLSDIYTIIILYALFLFTRAHAEAMWMQRAGNIRTSFYDVAGVF